MIKTEEDTVNECNHFFSKIGGTMIIKLTKNRQKTPLAVLLK